MEEILAKVGVVDIVLLVALLFGLILGFVKGFGKQFGKLFNLCLSVCIALVFYEKMAEFVYSRTIMQQPIAESLALFVILVVSSLLIKLILMIVGRVVTIQFVYFIERVGGAFLGGFRYALFICYLSYIVLLWPSEYLEPFFSEKSFSGPVIMEVIPKVKSYTDPLKDMMTFSVQPEAEEEIAPAVNEELVAEVENIVSEELPQ